MVYLEEGITVRDGEDKMAMVEQKLEDRIVQEMY